MSLGDTLQREKRVAFSRKAQPVWFRVTKWIVAIGVSVWLWPTPYFKWWILGGILLSSTVHFTWRWKTKRWTQPWGGWNDVEAANKTDPQ